MIGIVEKPQFDMHVFKIGGAVYAKQVSKTSSRWYNYRGNKLVAKVTPLVLTLHGVDSEGDLTEREIAINEIVSGDVKLELLVRQDETAKCGVPKDTLNLEDNVNE